MKQSEEREEKKSLMGKILQFIRPRSLSIIDALKHDHEDLKKLIELLKARQVSVRKKNGAYLPFASLLKSHIESEQEVVYRACTKLKQLALMGHEGFVEHNIATALMQNIARTRKTELWQAKVKVLAEMIQEHIEEEENILFPQIESLFSLDQKIIMAERFMNMRSRTQEYRNRNYMGILSTAA